MWEKYDPTGSGLITTNELLTFLTELKQPLGIKKSFMDIKLYATLIC